MIDPVLILPITLCFTVYWAVSGAHKLRGLTWFQGVLAGYNLFPSWALKPISILVALTEIGIAIALICAPLFGAAASIGLLVVYVLLLSFNQLRGQILQECGCEWGHFKPPNDRPLSVRLYIIRNAGLILLSTLMLSPQSQRDFTLLDGLNGVCAALCFFGLVAILKHLYSNYSRMKEFGHV